MVCQVNYTSMHVSCVEAVTLQRILGGQVETQSASDFERKCLAPGRKPHSQWSLEDSTLLPGRIDPVRILAVIGSNAASLVATVRRISFCFSSIGAEYSLNTTIRMRFSPWSSFLGSDESDPAQVNLLSLCFISSSSFGLYNQLMSPSPVAFFSFTLPSAMSFCRSDSDILDTLTVLLT